MEKGFLWGRKRRGYLRNMDEVKEEEEAVKMPPTPREPMEFLSRSWSISVSEMTKALLAGNKKRSFAVERPPEMMFPDTVVNIAGARSPQSQCIRRVIVEIKSKHIGGALSKKKKSIVYEVYDGDQCDAEERCYFGIKTAQSLLKFECESKLSKQKWVDGLKKLLQHVKNDTDADSI